MTLLPMMSICKLLTTRIMTAWQKVNTLSTLNKYQKSSKKIQKQKRSKQVVQIENKIQI